MFAPRSFHLEARGFVTRKTLFEAVFAKSTEGGFSRKKRFLVFFLPLSIVALWGVLYLPNLAVSPTWYGDETLAVSAAQSLLQNAPAHRAMKNSFWNPYAPYQPGYLYAIGAGMVVFENDILGARVVNAVIGLLVALTIFFKGRRVLGVRVAWVAALWLLSYEQSVIHYRWVFTHNLVGLGFLWGFLSLCGARERRGEWSAGLGFAVSASSLPIAIYGVFAACCTRWKTPLSWFRVSLAPAVVVVASMLLALFFHFPEKFLFSDLRAMLHFYWGATEQNSGSLLGAVRNFGAFFTQDGWHFAGLLGFLVCLTDKKIRPLAVGGLLVAVFLVQNRQNLPLFYYQAMILLPLLSVALWHGISLSIRWFASRVSGAGRSGQRLLHSLPLVPLVLAAALLPSVFSGNLQPRIKPWTTQSVAEVLEVAEWVNTHTSGSDLVIAHHNIAWLLHCRTADYLQATTWFSFPTWPFEKPLPKEEFFYAPDPAAAKFAVVADIDRRWTFSQPNVMKMIEQQGIVNWEPCWQGKYYLVLKNPAFEEK